MGKMAKENVRLSPYMTAAPYPCMLWCTDTRMMQEGHQVTRPTNKSGLSYFLFQSNCILRLLYSLSHHLDLNNHFTLTWIVQTTTLHQYSRALSSNQPYIPKYASCHHRHSGGNPPSSLEMFLPRRPLPYIVFLCARYISAHALYVLP